MVKHILSLYQSQNANESLKSESLGFQSDSDFNDLFAFCD